MIAPERIWAYEFDDGETIWHTDEIPNGGNVEYIRADIFAARIAELEAENARLRETITELQRCIKDQGFPDDGHMLVTCSAALGKGE